MLNGAAINSFAINANQQHLIAASAEVRLEFVVTATGHDTEFASANVACAFDLESFCVRIPQAAADIVIAVLPVVSPYTSYNASSDISFELFLSPSSVFAVFALATIEFRTEAIANAKLGRSEVAIYIEIASAKGTKIQPAEAVIDCSIFVEESLGYTIAGALAETEIVFAGFFAPDLNFIRHTAAFIECIFDIDSYVAVSPRLAESFIEFDIASTVLLFRANSATIDTAFLVDAFGTRVRPAEASISMVFGLDNTANHIISTEAVLGFMFVPVCNGHHDAYAHSVCGIEFGLLSTAFYKRPVTSEIFLSFTLDTAPRYYGNADCNVPFIITIDPIEKHISLAEQLFANIRCRFVVSPIPSMIHRAFTFVDMEFIIESVGRLALQTHLTIPFIFKMSAIASLVAPGESDVMFAILIEHPDAIIGIYEPADECRTIYVEPDYNVIFIQYEERELRIAC